MRRLTLLAAALAAFAGSATVGVAAPAKWVVITKPMFACWNTSDSAQANGASLRLMQSQIVGWRPGARLAGDCAEMEVGSKLMIEEQSGEAVKLIDWCTPGCSPYQWPTFAPPQAIVGRYLEPTTAPRGLEGW